MKERAIVLGIFRKNDTASHIDRRLEEMRRLCMTAGIEVLESFAQRSDSINPAYYAGTGKLEQIGTVADELKADLIVTAMALSPVQHRNIETMLNMKVIDRNELILIIFAKNAKSNISKIEAELAQYRYLLPMLTGKGIMMSRTGGGIGTRGPGEKKLEIDRRRIEQRIHLLNKRLAKYKQDSMQRRKSRKNAFNVSLVGYTNAGKTTIMNALTSKALTAQDSLFTTLDTTTRKLTRDIVLTDTIGFLGELPHELIQSFDLTLSEASDADLKLIVCDISDRYAEENLYDVSKVLSSLGFMKGKVLYVFNKTDSLVDSGRIKYFRSLYPESVFISAKSGYNIDLLKNAIEEKLRESLKKVSVTVDDDESEIINFILSKGHIVRQNSEKRGIHFEVFFNDRDYSHYRAMRRKS